MSTPQPPRTPPSTTGVPHTFCTDGPTLCRVRVLTDAQWREVPDDRKPERAEHVPGLGWVVAFPVEVLN